MDYTALLNICRILISERIKKENETITSELIKSSIAGTLYKLGTVVSDEVAKRLLNDLESIFTTWIDIPLTLVDGNHKPWLPSKQLQINWQYWERYRQYLKESGWAEETINRLDEITFDTLGQLEDPNRESNWDIRGLVVGHVQSGKTANYSGLICRAIDAGYKVIVVLAGTLNNLRSQTQIRIDESVLGFDSIHNLDSKKREPIGAGRVARCFPPVDTVTTRSERGDFKRAVANQFGINPGGNPLIFIIKKNGSVLRNLIQWVEWASQNHGTVDGKPYIRHVPLLVIDDEADYGSVDTRRQTRDDFGQINEEHNPTIINQRIRQLLLYFEKSAYIGYTATPFANIFIHPQSNLPDFGEDLFPRNFITCLPNPSDYIGPAQIFGIVNEENTALEEEEGLPLIREVDDVSEWIPPGHPNHYVPSYKGRQVIPPSLKKAIMSFILSCAIRKTRGQDNAHNSMLIHVTRFVSVQQAVYNQVVEHLTEIKHRLQYGDGDRKPSIIDEFKQLWDNDYFTTSRKINKDNSYSIDWLPVKACLTSSALEIVSVRQINGSVGDILDYYEYKDTGLSIIAVGGDKLSRGLTLEGLTVSYFLRTSHMYDTLMQMGRWFGYRPHYVDVCRLYLPNDLREWFRHITLASEELRNEFAYMASTGGKPIDYGLKVRSHPSLLVTAPVKMRQGTELYLSYEGSICETVVFRKDESFLRSNHKAAMDLIDRITALRTPEQNPTRQYSSEFSQNWSGLLWSDVDVKDICRFLREYQTHEDARKVNVKLISEYIEQQFNSSDNNLSGWSIFLANGSKGLTQLPSGINNEIRLSYRAWNRNYDPKQKGVQSAYRIGRLLNPGDESVDLGTDEWLKAMDLTLKSWNNNKDHRKRTLPPTFPDSRLIREVRSVKKGLLMLYFLESDSEKSDIGDEVPIVAIGLSFPSNSNDVRIPWVVNTVFHDQEFGDME